MKSVKTLIAFLFLILFFWPQKNYAQYSNVNLGWEAGHAGIANVCIGDFAGMRVTGDYNTFLGTSSGHDTDSGTANVFVGSLSGRWNNTGVYNSFLGTYSGRLNRGGYHNVFFGASSGEINESGFNNTFLGTRSGRNATGSGNVFLGFEAGFNETGSNKLYIANSGTSTPLIYGDFTTGKIGFGTTSLYAFNFVINGLAMATGGMWLNSDERFKEDRMSISSALKKVESLNGLSYRFKTGEATQGRIFPQGTQYGFYAQELQKVLPELVQEDGTGYLAVNYQGVIPVLVEAIKELSQELTALKETVGNSTNVVNNQTNRISSDRLEQNYPNPFDQSTTIRYHVTDETSIAQLYIFDLQGTQVDRYDLTPGHGEVTIPSGKLAAGLYHYSLVVNGQIIDTKKMILSR